MAIDMIENNELGALAPSRLGNYEFADDAYRNYTGSADFFDSADDGFRNLFGSRKKKMSSYSAETQRKFANLSQDCDKIQGSIDIINVEIQRLLKLKQNLKAKTQLKEAQEVLADFKTAQISQNCEKQLSEAKTTQEREQTLKTLSELSDTSVGKAQQELAGLQQGAEGQDNTKKLLIYGGIGLAALVAIILIVRK
jgi:hypothetical protein